MAKSTQDPHKRRAAYLSERRALIESEQKSSEQFDKGILTLAAGALAVSLVFLEKSRQNHRTTLSLLCISHGSR